MCEFECCSCRGVLNTTLFNKVCQWLATGLWFSPGTLVSSTNKANRNNIAEIFMKVALNTITLTQNCVWCLCTLNKSLQPDSHLELWFPDTYPWKNKQRYTIHYPETRSEIRCSRRMSSSFSTSGTCHVTIVANLDCEFSKVWTR